MQKKNETNADPPWGYGERERKSLLKKYFLLLLFITISANGNIRNLLVLIRDETKILQLSKLLRFQSKGRPLGGFERSRGHFRT